MPTLLLSARQTDDAQKLWRACIAEKWDVVRVHDWRARGLELQRFPFSLLRLPCLRLKNLAFETLKESLH